MKPMFLDQMKVITAIHSAPPQVPVRRSLFMFLEERECHRMDVMFLDAEEQSQYGISIEIEDDGEVVLHLLGKSGDCKTLPLFENNGKWVGTNEEITE